MEELRAYSNEDLAVLGNFIRGNLQFDKIE